MVFLLPSSSPLHKQLLDSDPLSPDLASRLGEPASPVLMREDRRRRMEPGEESGE
jgi:hypothetical protein